MLNSSILQETLFNFSWDETSFYILNMPQENQKKFPDVNEKYTPIIHLI